MKKLIAVLIVVLMLFALVSCDYSDTIEGYSNNLNSTLHGLLDPYLKEDEKYKDGYQEESNADAQREEGSSLSADPEN